MGGRRAGGLRRALRATVLVAVVSGSLLPSPGSAQSPVAPSPSDPGASPIASVAPSVAPSPTASPPPPVLRVVDRGSKPRAVRRYAFVPGAVETVTMELAQGVRTSIGNGVETAFDIPTVRYTMTVTIEAVDDAGVATMELAVGGVEVVPDADAEEPLDEATIAQIDATLQPLVGVAVRAQVAPDGSTLAIAADTTGLDPTIAQQITGVTEQLAQQAMTLPAVPVGRGARWIATSQLSANGITFRSRQTLTLKAVDGDRLAVEVRSRQTGIPGPIALPGLPAGYTASVVSLDGEAQNRSVIDLGSVIAETTGSGTVRVELSASDGTETQTTTTTVTTELEVRRVE